MDKKLLIAKLEERMNRLPTEQEVANSEKDHDILLSIILDRLEILEAKKNV